MNSLSLLNKLFSRLITSALTLYLLSGCTDSDNTTTMTTVKDGTVVETAALVSPGEKLYNDTDLSVPAGQSCASYHDINLGFDDPDESSATSLGADNIS